MIILYFKHCYRLCVFAIFDLFFTLYMNAIVLDLCNNSVNT